VKLKKILFATEFNALNLEALLSLLDLKLAGMEEIILTHIIPRDQVAFVPYGGYLKGEEKRLREEAKIRFEDWLDDVARAGLQVKVVIEVGEPAPQIMKIAEAEKVDLIVSGKIKRTGLEKVYSSSHTLELLRRSTTIPVYVSKHTPCRDMDEECGRRLNEHPFVRPLFATDWSPPSDRALEFIKVLGKAVQKVDVIHVIDLKEAEEDANSAWERLKAESHDHLDRYCLSLREAGIASEPHLAAGPMAAEVLRLCAELNSTMTILGTTGKNRLRSFFLGSLSREIMKTSHLPTLLVP